jgi:hypothetical protein
MKLLTVAFMLALCAQACGMDNENFNFGDLLAEELMIEARNINLDTINGSTVWEQTMSKAMKKASIDVVCGNVVALSIEGSAPKDAMIKINGIEIIATPSDGQFHLSLPWGNAPDNLNNVTVTYYGIEIARADLGNQTTQTDMPGTVFWNPGHKIVFLM